MDKFTLLCVEDDIEALEDIVYLLQRYFFKIYTANDGETALDMYNTHKPDIILLDINIPKLNGLEVASKIRNLDENTPIIFLTAHSQKDKLLQAIDLQVSSYIIKPFNIQELKDTIIKTIKKINTSNNQIVLNNNFTWDKDSKELFYKTNNIILTKNETLLIILLLKHKSTFLSSQSISVDISTTDKDISGNNIVQLISRFKKKLQQQLSNNDFFIENIYGNGYRIK